MDGIVSYGFYQTAYPNTIIEILEAYKWHIPTMNDIPIRRVPRGQGQSWERTAIIPERGVHRVLPDQPAEPVRRMQRVHQALPDRRMARQGPHIIPGRPAPRGPIRSGGHRNRRAGAAYSRDFLCF